MIKIVTPQNKVSGSTFIRQYQPLLKLQEKYPEEFNIMVVNENGLAEASCGADIYFAISPAFESHYEIIKYLKKYNKENEVPNGIEKLNIVCDYDDAPENIIPPTNHKAYVHYGLKECTVNYADGVKLDWVDKNTVINVGGFGTKFNILKNRQNRSYGARIKRMADYITTTTDKLGKRLSRYNKNIEVLPNVIDMKLYNPNNPNTDEDSFRIGWVIGDSHYDDYAECKEQLMRHLRTHKNSKLIIMTQLEIDENEWFEVKDRVEIVGGVNITQGYHNVFNELRLDLGLAHVENNDYNMCKSNLKWLEYSACKVPTLCSSSLYGDYMKDKVTGFLYNTVDEIRDNLNYLSKRKEMCKKVGQSAYDMVNEHYNIDNEIERYRTFFHKITGK